jgi:membrane-associated phospholipid phosphatase
MSRRRLIWLIIILIVLALYFPVNRMAHGGVQLSLPIDKLIPLYPPAVVPYLLGDILFIAFPIWAAIRIKPQEFEAYTVSILFATLVSYLAYLIFPTFVIRPHISSTDVFSKALVIIYQTDKAYNAAPSGHTFYSALSFAYLSRWKPKYKPIWILATLLILASALLTKQHYVLDIVCGLALGILAFAVGRFYQTKWNLEFAS